MRSNPWVKRILLAAVLLSGWCAAAAPARAEDGRIGEPWEAGIRLGIERQERERKQHAPETLVRRAKLLASRSASETDKVVRLYLLARAYGIAGDPRSADGTYRDVLRLAPRCYFAYHDLALLAMEGQPPRPPEAERYLKQALSLNARFHTAERKLAMMLLQSDRHADALRYLRRIVDGEPLDLQARFLLAQTLLLLKRTDEAEREVSILIRKEPRSPGFRELMGEVYFQRKRYADALRVFQRVAKENPTAPTPFQGMLRVLDAQRKAGGEIDVETYLYALEGLSRITTNPEAKAELKKIIDEIRRHEAMAQGTPTEGPPSDAQIAAILQEIPAEGRVEMLRYVYARDDAPTGDLLREVMRRLSPRTEPDPTARQWALRVLGRFGGFGLVGLVRHSLGDPDPSVRVLTTDVLLELSRNEATGEGAALLILGLHADSDDEALAVAARAGVRSLIGAAPDEVVDVTEDARRATFRTWWQGPVAAEAQIKALGRFPDLKDPKAEDVLLPYLEASDPYVVLAAWRATAAAAARLIADADAWAKAHPGRPPRMPAARRRWLGALPRPPGEALGREGVESARPRLRTWAAERPR